VVDAGWYNDPSDPALARWHDGEGFTEHTVVKAQWASAPPPPTSAPPSPPEPEPTTWMPATTPPSALPPPPPPELLAATPPAGAPGGARTAASIGERYRAWPRWGRIAAPIAAIAVLIGGVAAAQSSGDDGKVDTAAPTSTASTATTVVSTTANAAASLASAAGEARGRLPFGVSQAAMEHVILALCDGGVATSADAIEAITLVPQEEYQTLQAGRAAAKQACPTRMEAFPYLAGDVQTELGNRKAAATQPAITAAPTTTPTVTQAPRTTKPPVPTTPAPTTTRPPATSAPASNCDPNYSGCLNPNSPDYDCIGGGGNGPDYTGTVQVLGNDHFGLDSDHDGVGCE
jgi:hypothetical protein